MTKQDRERGQALEAIAKNQNCFSMRKITICAVIAFVFLSCEKRTSGTDVQCTQEGDVYFSTYLEERCCEELVPVSAMDVPMDDYNGDDYPPGCGPGDMPPNLMICTKCGDSVCGLKEQFCNCPADCPKPFADAGHNQ